MSKILCIYMSFLYGTFKKDPRVFFLHIKKAIHWSHSFYHRLKYTGLNLSWLKRETDIMLDGTEIALESQLVLLEIVNNDHDWTFMKFRMI